MSETFPQSVPESQLARAKRWEMLRLLNWSFIAPPRSVHTASPERLAEIDSFRQRDEKIIATAYYALELCNRRLPSLQAAVDRLEDLRSGTSEAIAIVDDFILSRSVSDELWAAYADFEPAAEKAIYNATDKYKPQTNAWLRSIQKMRNTSDSRQRIGPLIALSAETVARLTIAYEAGIDIHTEDPEVAAGIE